MRADPPPGKSFSFYWIRMDVPLEIHQKRTTDSLWWKQKTLTCTEKVRRRWSTGCFPVSVHLRKQQVDDAKTQTKKRHKTWLQTHVITKRIYQIHEEEEETHRCFPASQELSGVVTPQSWDGCTETEKEKDGKMSICTERFHQEADFCL